MVKAATLSLQELNARRRRAVELRLKGATIDHICGETGLSAPTVIGAYRAFLGQGWLGVATRSRGRAPGTGRALTAAQEEALLNLLLKQPPDSTTTDERPAAGPGRLWTPDTVQQAAQTLYGQDLRDRALTRFLHRAGLAVDTLSGAAGRNPALAAWQRSELPALMRQARQQGAAVVWCGQYRPRPVPQPVAGARATLPHLLLAQTLRGSLAWLPLQDAYRIEAYTDFLSRLAATWPGDTMVLLHGIDFAAQPALSAWLAAHPGWSLRRCPVAQTAQLVQSTQTAQLVQSTQTAQHAQPATPAPPAPPSFNPPPETHSS